MTDATLPDGFDGSGASDMTATLNAWLPQLGEGTRVNFTGKAVRIDGIVELEDQAGLTFVGGTFFTTYAGTQSVDAMNKSQWLITDCDNIRYTGMTVIGANPRGGISEDAYDGYRESQHAWEMQYSRNVTVENCTSSDIYGDFIYCGPHLITGAWCEDITVRGCDFRRNGRQGVALTGARRVLVEDCYMTDLRRANFDLEPNDAIQGGVSQVTIRNNTFGQRRLIFLTVGGQGPVSDVYITGNTLVNATLNSQVVADDVGSRRSNFVFADNVSDVGYGSDEGVCIAFYDVEGVRVTGNTQPLSAGRDMALVGYDNCAALIVTGNTYTNGTAELRDIA